MRALIPTAATLALALVASAAPARVTNTIVAANTSSIRKILIHERGWGESLSFEMNDVFPEQSGFVEPPAFLMTLSGAPCLGAVPIDDFWADLDLQSGAVYVLYLTVNDVRRRILSFNLSCSRWSAGNPLLGTFATRGYLMDGVDWDRSFWRDQMMNDEVIVEVNVENRERGEIYPIFEGVIPPVAE